MKLSAPVIAVTLALCLSGLATGAGDPVSRLANDVCGAHDLQTINTFVYRYISDDRLEPEEVAEAFGVATFLGDLGRCANQQAILDAFFLFKKDKDISALDIAFARGRVAAKPASSPSSGSGGKFQGSFVALGTAGEPPSIQ